MASSRRNFLTRGGAAVVYSLAAARPKRARAAASNDQLGVGFIGSGIRGTQLIDDFRANPAVRCVAVTDLYDGCLARAKEQLGPGIVTGKDYRRVLDNKDIDAVVIATPDHLHRRITLDALSAGKHIYVEKPLTWSIEEGSEIIAAEKASGKVLQVGSQGKTSPLTAKAREIIKSGALGQVTMVRMANHRNTAMGAWKYEVPPDASPQTIDWTRFLGDRAARKFDARAFFQWRCWWEFSGGVATDLFVHLLTWLHEVMDVPAPSSVVSQGGLYFWKDGRDVPDVMNSVFEYDGFVADMYVHLANTHQTGGTEILGTKASLAVERDQLVFYPEPTDHGVQGYGTLHWPKAARARYFESKGYTPEGRPREPHPAPKEPEEIKIERGPSHADHFIASVRERKPSKENALEGHLAAGAGHLANLAYRRGKKMRWDWKTGKVWEA